MEFLSLQIHYSLINLIVILLIVASTSSFAATSSNFPILAKPNCSDRCGNISIPFPFGTTKECSLNYDFLIICNQTFNDPPKVLLKSTSIEIRDISLDGQLRVLNSIARDCYDRNGSRVSSDKPWINLPPFTISNTANKFTIVGCDTYGSVSGKRLDDRDYRTGCSATCDSMDDLEEGSCTGLGCCQTSIPKNVRRVRLSVNSYYNYSSIMDFNDCGYAFVVEEKAFVFSRRKLTNLKNVKELSMVVDWSIGNETCVEAQKNSSAYACKSVNSKCYEPNNGAGYRCSCLKGYQGNPYLPDGCQDIDECQDPHICEKHCVNTPGGFQCVCPRGYHGDGKKDGQGCIRGESRVSTLVAGIFLGIIVLLLSAWWLYLVLQKRKLIKMRQHYFDQNGGTLLRKELKGREGSPDMIKIFSESELKGATNNFDSSMMVGQGGYGTVYKGFLSDKRVVAIKKAKEVPKQQINQFINEVIVLSQINHRNVVKLLGCCLETQTPLLVYEFISKGTLSEHIHNKANACSLSWGRRLKIATETAGVLSYLHSAASPPIIHRDVKSANILVDDTFTAKVSDFGASRLFPLDKTQLTTLVQGTFGYLDPEYMQTSQLTEKSDVYSFGVVLVELLTGRKAVSYDGPEEEISLANYFLSVMKEENSLFGILEDNVAKEGNEDLVTEVAYLAKRCLNVKGDERPSMKDVEMKLKEVEMKSEGLRAGVKHSSIQIDYKAEDMEILLGDDGSSSFTSFEGSSTSFGCVNLKDR